VPAARIATVFLARPWLFFVNVPPNPAARAHANAAAALSNPQWTSDISSGSALV
jgi:hypothetical protein